MEHLSGNIGVHMKGLAAFRAGEVDGMPAFFCMKILIENLPFSLFCDAVYQSLPLEKRKISINCTQTDRRIFE